jgi:hypothetical protein
MKLPFLRFASSRRGKLSRSDAKVFAEACELAQLRLEQCLADSYICVPIIDDRRIHRWPSAPKKSSEPALNPVLIEVSTLAVRGNDPARI